MKRSNVFMYKQEIIQSYLNGTTIAELARTYRVHDNTIKRELLRNNIKIRNKRDLRIPFNENFFFENSPELYYMLGFALGDGTIIKRKSSCCFQFTIHNKDESILRKFCSWTNFSPLNIKRYRNNKYVRLTFNRSWFSKKLEFAGIVPRKTYNPAIPHIDKKYIKPFLIGLIDADGSILFRKNIKKPSTPDTFQIVGNIKIMDWFMKSLNELGFFGKINQQFYQNKIYKRIRIQKKNEIVELAKILDIKNYYQLCLKRKWDQLIIFAFNNINNTL